jgi:hypothetical protein
LRPSDRSGTIFDEQTTPPEVTALTVHHPLEASLGDKRQS